MLRELLGDTIGIRAATPADLSAITAIQNAAPDASHWESADYLDHDCLIAVDRSEREGRVVGFLLSRRTAQDEREILNLAVDPAYRRQGIARRLLDAELVRGRNTWYLEVRESNTPARKLYQDMGFQEVGTRDAYYHNPDETGIVMRIFS